MSITDTYTKSFVFHVGNEKHVQRYNKNFYDTNERAHDIQHRREKFSHSIIERNGALLSGFSLLVDSINCSSPYFISLLHIFHKHVQTMYRKKADFMLKINFRIVLKKEEIRRKIENEEKLFFFFVCCFFLFIEFKLISWWL